MKNITIIGRGVSGNAAERLAKNAGFNCAVVTDTDCQQLPECDLIVVSPGVPPLTSRLYRQAVDSGVPMVSEIEFAYGYCKYPLLAVTGTNGKTTTTELTCHLLKNLGVRAEVAGNIGRPLADLVIDEPDLDVAVVEVSNFQLELTGTFAPLGAVLLNLASDHIDRYAGGFAEYCQVKERVFDNVIAENRIYGLSFSDSVRRVRYQDGRLFCGGIEVIDLAETDLPGFPNAENAAAALELVLCFMPDAVDKFAEKLAAGFKSFRRDAHRIEFVGQKQGITFINDSKGTNPAAVEAAIGAVRSEKIVIMLGGLAKGMDFSCLRNYLPRFRKVVLFGRDRAEIAGQMQLSADAAVDCGSDFNAAFDCAVKSACAGDTVLLSPGCASMDMFENYKERGNVFRQMVNEL